MNRFQQRFTTMLSVIIVPCIISAQDEFTEITEPLTPVVPSLISRIQQAVVSEAGWFIILMTLLGITAITTKRLWLRYPILLVSLAYLGFYRGGCPCPVTAHAQTASSIISGNPYWVVPAVLLLIVIVLSLVAGRFFCGFVCPLGAVQDILSWINRKIIKPSYTTSMIGRITRWIVFAGMLAAAYKTGAYHFKTLDPFRTLFLFSGTLYAWVIFSIMAGISVIFYRPFCAFFCPLGAVLELISKKTVLAIRLNKTCLSCKACNRCCPVGAISENGTVNNGMCIRCGKCLVKTSCFSFGKR